MHAEAVRLALAGAMAAAAVERGEREPDILAGTPGFYLDFELPVGSEDAAERLENRQKHIELVAVRPESADSPARATVFVPDAAADHFLRKVEQYRDENTRNGKPKNEALIASIQSVALAAVRSLYTDDAALFPAAAEPIWWEIWLRQGHANTFDATVQRLEIPAQLQKLVFPDREVRLIYGSEITIMRVFVNTDSIAEIRRARDTPAEFMRWSNVEQAARAADLAGRVDAPENPQIAVCLLDTGVTQSHPLLSVALDPGDVLAYDPTWPGGDSHGHGTNMAGSALYGDLTPLFAGNGRVPLTHCLESVKILPDQGQNEPKLYGAITRESIARAEVQAPERRRAVCMAVTSGRWNQSRNSLFMVRGRRSTLLWRRRCPAPDPPFRRQYSRGAVESRLSVPERGRTDRESGPGVERDHRGRLHRQVRDHRSDVRRVGTRRASGGFVPDQPHIRLLGTEVAAETGHRARRRKLGGTGRSDRLSGRTRPLTTTGIPPPVTSTSFGTPVRQRPSGANLAGKIIAAMPQRWPETIRALMIHSAEWTPAMRQKFDAAGSEQQKRVLAPEVRIRRARLLPRRFERSQ